jgi:hypothetical protein
MADEASEARRPGSSTPENKEPADQQPAFPINIADIDLSKVLGGLAPAKGGSSDQCCW